MTRAVRMPTTAGQILADADPDRARYGRQGSPCISRSCRGKITSTSLHGRCHECGYQKFPSKTLQLRKRRRETEDAGKQRKDGLRADET